VKGKEFSINLKLKTYRRGEMMERQMILWEGQEGEYRRVTGEGLELPDGEVLLYRNFLDWEVGDRYFQELLHQTRWRQDYLQVHGKSVPLPRLTAWYGDGGYAYSGIAMEPEPWTPTLLAIKAQVEALAKVAFNSVLLNLYRNGQDSVSWHSDNEPELRRYPAIASVSLGATRRFSFKHKRCKDLKPIHLELPHGSLLLMQGSTQIHWLHQVPKTTQSISPRVNLTFRRITF
jgi:alkylated DNA repair dioxygenase AlkB